MQAWEIHERLCVVGDGEWVSVSRGGTYRAAPERALAWRCTRSGDAFCERFVAEEGWVAEKLGGAFQRVLERGTTPRPYLVLEPVRGVALRVVFGRGPAAPAAATRVGVALAEAASAAHSVVAADGSSMPVHGLGFGADTVVLDGDAVRIANPRLRPLWSRRDPAQAPRSVDVDFLAPEQARGDVPVAETDVYAIALVVLALFLGRSPLDRGWALPTVAAAMSADIHPADLDALPPPLRAVLLQALDREPDKRPFGPEQLAGRLLEAVPESATASLGPLTEGLPRTWLPGV